MSRKAWLVCKLYSENLSDYETQPSVNDERWKKNDPPEKGKVYWIQKDSLDMKLAFYIGTISGNPYPWYHFEKNEPISNVKAWMHANKIEKNNER